MFLLSLCNSSNAQFGGQTGMGSVWHYPGQIGVEIGIKRSPIGWNYSAGGSQYLSSNSYLKGTAFFDDGYFERVKLQSFGVNAMYFYSPYSIAETVFFNVGAGLTGNYDLVKNYWPNTNKKLNYGIVGGIEIEAAIADYLMVTGTGLQRYLKNDSFGRGRYEIGLGIKYLIN